LAVRPGPFGRGSPGTPVPGPRSGDRAPPRGVDVKPSLQGPPQGAPRAPEGPDGHPGPAREDPGDPRSRRAPDPEPGQLSPEGEGASHPGRPGSGPGPRTRQLREGGFTSTPRAGALSPGWPGSGIRGSRRSPGLPGGRKDPPRPRPRVKGFAFIVIGGTLSRCIFCFWLTLHV